MMFIPVSLCSVIKLWCYRCLSISRSRWFKNLAEPLQHRFSAHNIAVFKIIFIVKVFCYNINVLSNSDF